MRWGRSFRVAVGLLALGLLNPVLVLGNPPAQEAIDALMARWIGALVSEDSETLAGCYWPEAVSISYDPSGGSELLEGGAAIRQSIEAVFAEYDYPSLGMVYPEPTRFFPQNDTVPVYVYNYVEYRFIDVFYFEERMGEYRILRHLLLIDPQSY
jgi:hypothetical protein